MQNKNVNEEKLCLCKSEYNFVIIFSVGQLFVDEMASMLALQTIGKFCP